MVAVKLKSNPKLLIVDDEPNNHRVYERTLAALDIDFIKVFSGQEALAIAHKHDFFLILMDVQMPEMDGFETASILQDHPKTSQIPIIFLTAFARDEFFERKGYKSGAVDYLVKPIDAHIVQSKVKIFLDLFQQKLTLSVVCQKQKKDENKLLVKNRTLKQTINEKSSEIEISAKLLSMTEQHLLKSEKMASLGRLVAGMAHELNTPIGICVTGASMLQDHTNSFAELYASGQLKKKQLDKFLNKTIESTEIILSNVDRAAELISSFKLIAVDASNEMNREINLYEYIVSIHHSLKPEMRRFKHDISIDGDTELAIDTYPGSISQLLTNLLMNSLTHAFDEQSGGDINIHISQQNDEAIICYSDNGKGMSEETVEKVFDPFYTTRLGLGGSGLGMYISYNLVNEVLQGNMSCKSIRNEGCLFTITLPKIIKC